MSEPGWKAHPSDPRWERYWDGEEWVGEPRQATADDQVLDAPRFKPRKAVIGLALLAIAGGGAVAVIAVSGAGSSSDAPRAHAAAGGPTIEGARRTLRTMFREVVAGHYDQWCSIQGPAGQAYWAAMQRENISVSNGTSPRADLADCIEFGQQIAIGPSIDQFDQMQDESETVPITLTGDRATLGVWVSGDSGPTSMTWTDGRWQVSWGESTASRSQSQPVNPETIAAPKPLGRTPTYPELERSLKATLQSRVDDPSSRDVNPDAAGLTITVGKVHCRNEGGNVCEVQERLTGDLAGWSINKTALVKYGVSADDDGCWKAEQLLRGSVDMYVDQVNVEGCVGG